MVNQLFYDLLYLLLLHNITNDFAELSNYSFRSISILQAFIHEIDILELDCSNILSFNSPLLKNH